MTEAEVNSSRYSRDPSGFIFFCEGRIYRQINNIYKENYDLLIGSGLYKRLVDNALLIPHKEADIKLAENNDAYKVLEPEVIPFISYPYEWCFSQLKDAALTTIGIQKIALEFGMSLKDASAYNIQFRKGAPLLIDTLSFEKYREGEPWVAYRQFCEQFLGPLALMSYRDIRLNQLLQLYLDGIPLDLSSSILPLRTYFRPSLLSHIHLHARSQKYFSKEEIILNRNKMTRLGFIAIIENLGAVVESLKFCPKGSLWSGYYSDASYFPDAFNHKKQIVAGFLEKVNVKSVWDFGANIGLFSCIASSRGTETVSFDLDPYVVEKSYLQCVKNKEKNLLPLVMDVTNPSPSLGWDNKERMSLQQRGPVDAVFALALIHHLVFAHNLPLSKIASFFCKLCNYLIIEFVPKSDPQVKQMLSSREDTFGEYGQYNFETEFRRYFNLQESVKIINSERTIYLMKKITT
jgi:hypothetical protein